LFDIKAKELIIKCKASAGEISRSFAHFFKKVLVSLDTTYEDLSSSIREAISNLLKIFDLRKLSNRVVSAGVSLTHSMRSASRVSWVKLNRLTRSSKNLIFTISISFYTFLKNSYDAVSTWYFKKFKAYKGIAIVSGLEFMPQIGETVKLIINDYEFKYTALYNPVQALHGEPEDMTTLFISNLTPIEQKRMNKVGDILRTKTNPTIHESINLIRRYCGRLFLLTKQFTPNVFTIFTYILTPEEATYLKNRGYYLIYIQCTNPAYLTKFDTGVTFGSMRFHKYFFPDKGKLSIDTLKNLFTQVLTGVIHR
jgi:hypothetical protein